MKINTATRSFDIEFYDTASTRKILEKLPLSANANVWGKEIYFTIPISCDLEADARDIMKEGELAFYPPLNAFCIFWGPTPASTDSRPKAADRVNVLGKIKGDYTDLDEVKNGELITITKD